MMALMVYAAPELGETCMDEYVPGHTDCVGYPWISCQRGHGLDLFFYCQWSASVSEVYHTGDVKQFFIKTHRYRVDVHIKPQKCMNGGPAEHLTDAEMFRRIQRVDPEYRERMGFVVTCWVGFLEVGMQEGCV